MQDVLDVLIIGAGPAGMMAAVQSGKSGLKTVILEKKSRLGIKLSITGKGRCNITNSADIKEFAACFRNGKFLYSSLQNFPNTELITFFENLGVPCALERGGRYFPSSGKAQDIVDALTKEVKKYAKIITSFEVVNVTKESGGLFLVQGKDLSFSAKNVIVASGGLSYPSTGSTGDGYKIAKSFGHTVNRLSAALVPVILESRYLNELKGLKLKNVEVSVIDNDKFIAKEFGEAEFTVFGADGPVILTLSAVISEKINHSKMYLSFNLKPALSKEQLNNRILKELDTFGHNTIKEMLKEMLPLQLIKPFINFCGITTDKKCSQINKNEREKMIQSFFDIRFAVKGVKDIKEAIVTRGGVNTDEINQKTMESKLVKGLFFCGEVIDIDAPTGGFNLQAAFSTGYAAGSRAGGNKK